MSKTLINTIIILLFASALVLGYWYLGDEEQAGIGLTTSTATADGTLVVTDNSESDADLETDKQFVELLAALQSANLGINIFDDPVFANGFSDFHQPLPAVPAGRTNPFAPLPGQVISSGIRP
ncbi:MAG: hypothetical protein HYV76_00635 [Candidatus Vogelbacteria bacterium]|nr:hypothetical protein [Candidatus Vogelbacteria bacterium]